MSCNLIFVEVMTAQKLCEPTRTLLPCRFFFFRSRLWAGIGPIASEAKSLNRQLFGHPCDKRVSMHCFASSLSLFRWWRRRWWRWGLRWWWQRRWSFELIWTKNQTGLRRSWFISFLQKLNLTKITDENEQISPQYQRCLEQGFKSSTILLHCK